MNTPAPHPSPGLDAPRAASLQERYRQLDGQQQQLDALAAENERLGALTERQKQFIFAVVHDLRSPMTAIMGFNEVLQLRCQDAADPFLLELLQRIQTYNQLQLQLINTLLDFAQGDASGWPVRPEPAHLGALIAEEVALAQAEARLQGIALAADCPSGLPAAWADPLRVRQVLRNLIGNALRYTPTSGAVHVTAAPAAGGAVQVEIADTGVGIPAEHQQAIFEPYWRSAALPRAGWNGLGLGLAIVRGLVEQHGGQLGVRSEPGRGSTFWFTLPRAAS